MPMFSPQLLARVLNPHGLSCRVQIVENPGKSLLPQVSLAADKIVTEEDWYCFTFTGYRGTEKLECKVLVPFPTLQGGCFRVGDLERVLVKVAHLDPTAPPGQKVWRIENPGKLLIRELQQAFAAGLRDFYFTGTPPSSEAIRRRIGSIFNSSRLCPVLPTGVVGKQSLGELVYLEVPERGLDLEPLKFPENLTGILDPCSTTSGNKVNRVYRLCQGVKIDPVTQMAKPSGVSHCSTLADNAIAIDLCPHRANLLRVQFESALTLVNPESPFVCGERHSLSGVHLLTALMEYGCSTWEDCIVISETAAVKMRAKRYGSEVFQCLGPATIHVKEGDEILPDGHILGYGITREGSHQLLRTSRIKHRSWIEKITACGCIYFGKPAIRYRFHAVAHINAATGDKITTRAGTKGVVRVMPDEWMPVLEDGTRIECCMSPSSVVGRKAMLVLWEMMMNRMAVAENKRTVYPHLEQLLKVNPSFQELVSRGYGGKTQLFMGGRQLPYKTFVGPLYTLRLDKIASEIASVQRGTPVLNHHLLPVDSAKTSGRMRDLAKSMAMSSRGLHKVLSALVRENMRGTGHVRNMLCALEPERYL